MECGNMVMFTFFFHFSAFSKFLQNACVAYRIREKISNVFKAKQGHRSRHPCWQRSIFVEGILAAHVPVQQSSF